MIIIQYLPCRLHSLSILPPSPPTLTFTDVTFKFSYITPPTEELDYTLSYDDVAMTTDDSQQTLDYNPSDMTDDVDDGGGDSCEGGVKSDGGDGAKDSKEDLKPITGKKRRKEVCVYTHQSTRCSSNCSSEL